MTSSLMARDILLQTMASQATREDGTPDGNTDTLVRQKTLSEANKPPLYKILLLNDDYTPMEFVVEVLEVVFGMSHQQALHLMLAVHMKGIAVIGVFTREIAEAKVAQVMHHARMHEHPLQCTMERE